MLGSFGCDKNLLYLGCGHSDKPAFFGISSIQIYQQFNRLPLYIGRIYGYLTKQEQVCSIVFNLFNAYSDRTGVACLINLYSWRGLIVSAFDGFIKYILRAWLETDVWERLEPWLGLLKQYCIESFDDNAMDWSTNIILKCLWHLRSGLLENLVWLPNVQGWIKFHLCPPPLTN